MISIDFITNRIFNSRTYILIKEDSEKVWLVDCGDTDRILEMIGEKSVEGVLLTHAHSDHIYGLEKLIEKFPQIKIYTNTSGVEALKNPKVNLSHYHSGYQDISIVAPDCVCVIKEGDELNVMGEKVQVYETPGHAPSCITYIMNDKAFTGDAYIPGVKFFTGFPHSSSKLAVESVERILQLSSGCLILSGHTVPDGLTEMKFSPR